MTIENLFIETKTNGIDSPGSTGTARKLTAAEFNAVVSKINELIAQSNRTVYVTQAEYDALLANDQIDDDVEYNIYEGGEEVQEEPEEEEEGQEEEEQGE